MKQYSIRKATRYGEGYSTMEIRDNEGHLREMGSVVAEYRLTPGRERSEMDGMRRAINKHLANGGTMGNYQW